MLKIKMSEDIKELTKYGFSSFRASRLHTNYYFLCRDGEMLLCNNVVREIWRLNLEQDDTRVHSVPKYQKKGVHIEDGLYRIIKAGLVTTPEEEQEVKEDDET